MLRVEWFLLRDLSNSRALRCVHSGKVYFSASQALEYLPSACSVFLQEIENKRSNFYSSHVCSLDTIYAFIAYSSWYTWIVASFRPQIPTTRICRKAQISKFVIRVSTVAKKLFPWAIHTLQIERPLYKPNISLQKLPFFEFMNQHVEHISKKANSLFLRSLKRGPYDAKCCTRLRQRSFK